MLCVRVARSHGLVHVEQRRHDTSGGSRIACRGRRTNDELAAGKTYAWRTGFVTCVLVGRHASREEKDDVSILPAGELVTLVRLDSSHRCILGVRDAVR